MVFVSPCHECVHSLCIHTMHLFVPMLILIIEEQVKMVNAKPQGVTPVYEKSGVKKKIDGRCSATKTVQPARRRKMQKRDAQKNVNRRCSATKTLQPARRIAKKKIFFSDEESRAILHGYSRFRDKWNKWVRIRDYYWVFKSPENVGRTSVQIKDRHRTMTKSGPIPLDQDKNVIFTNFARKGTIGIRDC